MAASVRHYVDAVTEVREAEAADIESISAALVKAFDDDPLMGYLFPKATTRGKKSRAFFVSDAKRALTKGALFTTAGSAAKGGAIWMAPGQWKIGGLELLGQLPMLFRMGGDTPRSLALLSKVEKVHPTEPHWYLAVLGTDPQHQGTGVGSALMAPILEKCDADGVPAYLESSKESNVPFYKRHGFELRDEVNVKNGPTLWPMWRDPRPPGS
jgi:ribosomal protein S18 acetylase RimI-like enzyme